MSGLRELAAQATPGPWEIERVQLHWNEHVYRVAGGLHSLEDARLVALAPEMAGLLDEVFTEHWEDIDPELRAQFSALNQKAAQ